MAGSDMFLNVTENATNETFNCVTSELSSTGVTNVTHWRILDDLLYGTPIVSTVYVVFFLLAFFWNLFILITYLVKYHLLKEPGNIFLFNLALTDFLLTITVLLYSVVTEIAQEFVFGMNDVVRCRFCDAAGFFLFFLIDASLHLLTALSVDRLILLSRPLRYKQLMNKWKAIAIVLAIWILCFILALPPVFGFGQYEFNVRFGTCLARFTGQNPKTGLSNHFYVAALAVEAVIPVIILGFTNVFTYRLISKFLRRNLRRRSTFRKKQDREQTDDERKHHKQQRQLVRVFGALFISNIVSWTPVLFVIFLIFAVPAELLPNEFYIFGHICFLTNPVFHPMLESFFVKDLRYQIRRAEKGVKRAGTFLVRQATSSFFSNSKRDNFGSALDEANRRMDEEEAQRNAQRNKQLHDTVHTDSSDMPSSVFVHDSDHEEPLEHERKTPVKLGKIGRSVTFEGDNQGTQAAIETANNELSNGMSFNKNGVTTIHEEEALHAPSNTSQSSVEGDKAETEGETE